MPSLLNKWLWQLNLIVYCLFCCTTPGYAEQSYQVREYQMKATYLFKFGNFVIYPENVLSDDNTDFNICVLGEEPFQRILDTAVKGEKIQDHPVALSYFQTLEGIKNCHVLFISQSEQNRLADIFTHIRQRPILTVSDIKDFVSQGGIIEYFLEESKVKFYINRDRANELGLQISSQLLRMAIIKDSKPPK